MTQQRLAAIYARVSTEEQAKGLVTSLETQVALCRGDLAALSIPVASDGSGLIVQEQHSGLDRARAALWRRPALGRHQVHGIGAPR